MKKIRIYGDTASLADWLRQSGALYNDKDGWYFTSSHPPLPHGLTTSHPSQWRGRPGDRLSFPARIIRAIELPTSYGLSFLHIIEDPESNIYIWNTTSTKIAAGQLIDLRGTVKAHRRYHGVKQTILTRCTYV